MLIGDILTAPVAGQGPADVGGGRFEVLSEYLSAKVETLRYTEKYFDNI